jgi:hypothetical protein
LASTAAVAADKALVVALHPSSVGLVGGNVAHSAASTGNPVRVAGRVNTVVDTTLVAGDVCDLFVSSGGAQVFTLNSVPDVSWQYTGVLTTNTSTAVRAASASIRNYVTNLQLQNTSAVASVVNLLDGAVVIWSVSLPASMALPIDISFTTPKRGSVNSAMNVQLVTTGTNTYVNVGGFQAP